MYTVCAFKQLALKWQNYYGYCLYNHNRKSLQLLWVY